MAPQFKLTQQMQYIILGVILAGGALFVVINFVVAPLIATRKANLTKTVEIRAKLEDQRRVIKTGQNLQQQLDQAQAQIVRLSAHIPLPVLGNFLLGMEEHIRVCAKDLDVQIIQVANKDILEPQAAGFRVYRVQVTAQAGFRPLIRLFQNLQASNPLLSVSGLTILPCDDNPEKHNVSFTLAWLIWIDPAKRPDFLMKSQASEAGEN